MARTVSNGDRTISTKATEDFAQATKHDRCWVDAIKKFKGFDNSVMTDKLQNGTATVMIAKAPVWILTSQVGPPSEPPHPGKLGETSKKPPHGEAKATKGSENVFAEGKPVIRLDDDTTQNSGNTVGKVMAKKKPLDEESDGDGDGDGDADKNKNNTNTDTKPPTNTGARPPGPPTATVMVDQCRVTALYGVCDHNRVPKDGILEVTAGGMAPEKVWGLAGLNGTCPNQPHPVFSINGRPQPSQANPLNFGYAVPTPQNKPTFTTEAHNLILNYKMTNYPYDTIELSANGCIPGQDKITYRAFLGTGMMKRTWSSVDSPALTWLKILWTKFQEFVKLFAEFQGNLPFLDGKIDLEAQVKEDPNSSKVFVWFAVKLNFDPIVALNTKLPLSSKALTDALKAFNGKLMNFTSRGRAALQRWGEWVSNSRLGRGVADAWNSLAGKMPFGDRLGRAGKSFSEYCKETLERGNNSDWTQAWATAGIWAGGVIEGFNPKAIFETLGAGLSAGLFVTINGKFSAKADVYRSKPGEAPKVTQAGGTETMHLALTAEAKVLGGNLLSFTGGGGGEVTRGLTLFSDDRGFGVKDARLACTRLYFTGRFTLLAGLQNIVSGRILQTRSSGAIFDSADTQGLADLLGNEGRTLENPDTYDFVQQHDGVREALNFQQDQPVYFINYGS